MKGEMMMHEWNSTNTPHHRPKIGELEGIFIIFSLIPLKSHSQENPFNAVGVVFKDER